MKRKEMTEIDAIAENVCDVFSNGTVEKRAVMLNDGSLASAILTSLEKEKSTSAIRTKCLRAVNGLSLDEAKIFFSPSVVARIEKNKRSYHHDFWYNLRFVDQRVYKILQSNVFENRFSPVVFFLLQNAPLKIKFSNFVYLMRRIKTPQQKEQMRVFGNRIIRAIAYAVGNDLNIAENALKNNEIVKALYKLNCRLIDSRRVVERLFEVYDYKTLEQNTKFYSVLSLMHVTGPKLPEEYAHNKMLMDTIVDDFGPTNSYNLFYSFLDSLEHRNPEYVSRLIQERKRIVMQKEHIDIDDFSFLCFEDKPSNTLENLRVVLKWLSTEDLEATCGKKAKDALLFSTMALGNKNVDYDDLKNRVKKCGNNFFKNILYDGMRVVRQKFGDSLFNSISSPNSAKNPFSDCMIENVADVSKWKTKTTDDVRMFKLNGKPFNLLAHSTQIGKKYLESVNSIDDLYEFFDKNDYVVSCTMITEKNTSLLYFNQVVLGFYGIDPIRLVQANTNDSFSKNDYRITGKPQFTDVVPEYYDIETFKNKSVENINEIGFLSRKLDDCGEHEGGVLRPDCVLCYDNVSEVEYAIAQKHNLDIVVVETKYYENEFDGFRSLQQQISSHVYE